MTADNRFDAIIIGSGIGGLTCGAFLSRSGRRVLVLEQHSKIGGYTHSFRRGKYMFETGVHSAPLEKGKTIDHLLSLLGVHDRIERVALPEMYHVETPDYSLTMPSRKEDIVRLIHDRFPHQKNAFTALDRELDLLRNHIIRPLNNFENVYYQEDPGFVSRFHNLSYHDYISRHITDRDLQYAFYSQWPYGGISSKMGAALFHGMLFLLHYDEGSYTLKGGFSTLADALAHAITSRDGCVKTGSRVVGLETKGRKVICAHTDKGEEYRADTFVSNISPYHIHSAVLDKRSHSRRWQRRLSNLNPSVSSMVVYLGMKPGSVDRIKHSTLFWATTPDNEVIYRNITGNNKEDLDHLVLLKNTLRRDYPTLTLMHFILKSFSGNWKSDKASLTGKMIDIAEKMLPGLKRDIVVMETGSPETFERYTGNTGGAIYGFENIKTIYGEAKMPISTHLENFYQVGHWGRPGCGIWNVMVNGYTASHQIIKDLDGKRES